MSVHIEWTDLNYASAKLHKRNSIEDAYGSINELPALYIGECVIEGTREQWITFATDLLANAERLKK